MDRLDKRRLKRRELVKMPIEKTIESQAERATRKSTPAWPCFIVRRIDETTQLVEGETL